MEILSLQIQNFLTIGAPVALNLNNQGLVLVQGVNEDDTSAGSNGAGKSTIVDALCWAAFDKTARGETGDAVVNDTAGKDCFVRIMIKDGDVVYDVTRFRKHKEHKNQTVVNVAKTSDLLMVTNISKGTEKETQELINEIMGCSYDVFVAAIYAGQEEMPDIPKMTDKQLKLLIEEAAGVERLETAYELARREALEIEIAQRNIRTKRLNSEINQEALYDKSKNTKALYDLFESARQARSDEFKRAGIERVEIAKVLVSDLAKTQPEALKTRLATLQTQVDSIQHKRTELKVLTDTYHNKKVGLSNHDIIIEGAKKEALKFKYAHDNAETEMLKPCKSCGKPHELSEIEEYKKHQLEEFEKMTARLNVLIKERDVLDSTLIIAKKHMEEFEAEIAKLNPEVILTQSNEINHGLALIIKKEAEIAQAKVDIARILEKSKLAMSELNPHSNLVEFVQTQITEGEEKIKLLVAENEKLEADYQVASSISKVFGPAGVRAHILDTVTPFLNDRTSDYLSALSDGNITAVWTTIAKTAKGDLREKFNIEVSNAKGGKSFKLLSGGEKRKVRLATMLALQDLVASRATKPIQLWIGDEIDDALDSAGLERLMGILERKARERGTVLVISHNELSDWVDNVITVTKRGGYSTVEGVLCPT